MKVQPWHLGCIIILVLAAVYFLVGTREGMDTPTSSPLPPGPAGTAGGAIMSPPLVVPASSSSGAPTYNLTCTASPVSGMLGSAAAMPEAPPTWNINQPPPGWNSKFGYANHDTSETSGGMAGGITSGMMAGVSPTSPNIGHGEWKDHKELSRSAAGMGMSTPPPPPPPPPSAPAPASVSAASSVPASVPAGAAAK